ncbi:hypothetical protein ACMUMS_01655 [Acinetobacter courvalinii]|uniref:hypothetical protein n=1 Tax=Acinetobacter courvalinii TaxID=280147 RepID=UPI003A8B875A
MADMNCNNDIQHWAQALLTEESPPNLLSLAPQPLDPEIFPPEVVPATLANLFHYLIRNEKGQCEARLLPVIQCLFKHYPDAQQKLVQRILQSSSSMRLQHIGPQLLSISPLLDQQTHCWLIQQTLSLMFFRQWSDEQVRDVLKHLSQALQLDSAHMQRIIAGMKDIH